MSPVAANRRVHPRVAGPFDGWRIGLLDTPVSIFDLSIGGCYVNATHIQEPGRTMTLKIDLPQEGWIRVKALTLNLQRGLGFAVQFLEISEVDARRLDRTIRRLIDIDGV
jgi:hypothetical protein